MSQLLRRLRQENCLNPGGEGYSELRSCHCTPAWVTRVKLRLKKKKKEGYSLMGQKGRRTKHESDSIKFQAAVTEHHRLGGL